MLYVIPYFELTFISVAGYQFESWKLFWFFGRVIFLYVFFKEIKRLELSKKAALIIFLLNLFLINFFERLLFYFSHNYVLKDKASSLSDAFNVLSWGSSGRVYFGTIIGVFSAILIGSLITKQWKNVWKYLDAGFLAQTAGTFIYRIGNVLWHSHMGKITDVPWGIVYKGQIRHEVGLYELISLFVIFFIAWFLRKRIPKAGLLFTIILGLLSLSRFFTDFLRSTDLPNSNFHFQNGFTMNQIAYGVVFLICLGLFFFLSKGQKEKNFQKDDEIKPII